MSNQYEIAFKELTEYVKHNTTLLDLLNASYGDDVENIVNLDSFIDAVVSTLILEVEYEKRKYDKAVEYGRYGGTVGAINRNKQAIKRARKENDEADIFNETENLENLKCRKKDHEILKLNFSDVLHTFRCCLMNTDDSYDELYDEMTANFKRKRIKDNSRNNFFILLYFTISAYNLLTDGVSKEKRASYIKTTIDNMRDYLEKNTTLPTPNRDKMINYLKKFGFSNEKKLYVYILSKFVKKVYNSSGISLLDKYEILNRFYIEIILMYSEITKLPEVSDNTTTPDLCEINPDNERIIKRAYNAINYLQKTTDITEDEIRHLKELTHLLSLFPKTESKLEKLSDKNIASRSEEIFSIIYYLKDSRIEHPTNKKVMEKVIDMLDLHINTQGNSVPIFNIIYLGLVLSLHLSVKKGITESGAKNQDNILLQLLFASLFTDVQSDRSLIQKLYSDFVFKTIDKIESTSFDDLNNILEIIKKCLDNICIPIFDCEEYEISEESCSTIAFIL